MKAEKFWDFLAANYDAQEGDPSTRQDVEIIHKYLQPEDRALELACGTGTLALHVAGWVKEIHGIDISGKMVAAAKQKAAALNIGNTHFTQTTILEFGNPNESFDVVMAFNILHLLEDTQRAVHRINQLLKPGGIFISSTPCLGEKRAFINSLLSPLFMVPSKLGVIPYIRVFKIAELEDCLGQGSFHIIETKRFVGGLTDYLVVASKVGGS